MRQNDRGHQRGYESRPQTQYAVMTDYYDARNQLKKEVFVDWPKDVANSIRISRTNMRRAYDFVAAMRFRIQMGDDPASVLPSGMGQLSRFVQYQAGRDRAWQEAREFFNTQINAVGTDGRKFEGFYQLFQSVMAYLRR